MTTETIPEAAAPAVVETPPAVPAPAPNIEGVSPTPVAAGGLATPPAAPPAASPFLSPEYQAYVTSLEQNAERVTLMDEQRTVEESAARYAQRLVAENGLTEEQAQVIALREHQRVYRDWKASQASQKRLADATRLARQYGVNPQTLMEQGGMELVARSLGAASAAQKELTSLRAEVATLKQKLAPIQTFASGSVSPDGTVVTRENIHSLYLKDENRYHDVYARYLRTGQLS